MLAWGRKASQVLQLSRVARLRRHSGYDEQGSRRLSGSTNALDRRRPGLHRSPLPERLVQVGRDFHGHPAQLVSLHHLMEPGARRARQAQYRPIPLRRRGHHQFTDERDNQERAILGLRSLLAPDWSRRPPLRFAERLQLLRLTARSRRESRWPASASRHESRTGPRDRTTPRHHGGLRAAESRFSDNAGLEVRSSTLTASACRQGFVAAVFRPPSFAGGVGSPPTLRQGLAAVS